MADRHGWRSLCGSPKRGDFQAKLTARVNLCSIIGASGGGDGNPKCEVDACSVDGNLVMLLFVVRILFQFVELNLVLVVDIGRLRDVLVPRVSVSESRRKIWEENMEPQIKEEKLRIKS
ncbi:hypothetical protein Droror1_Dr00016085 [Drosera rotundifolia]